MKFNEFVNKMKAQGGIDKDGAYGKQCMDLYNYYMVNVVGLQDGKTGASCAKNILNNSYVMQNVERINNYLDFIPQKGDIAVWTGGTYGHVAICLGVGDVNTFKSLDQNWVSQKLTEETHNYTYLGPLVFLRPKNQSNIKENDNNYKITASNGVNFRKSYTTLSTKIGAIPKGTVLKVTEFYKGQTWYWGKTTYNGKTGWFAIKKNNNTEIYADKI